MRPLRADLEAAMWKKRYRELLLRDYRLGGVQTEVLVQLIRQIRGDGFEVVLFIMPTTDIHKSFFAPGQYESFLAHLGGLAAREGVPLVDRANYQSVLPDKITIFQKPLEAYASDRAELIHEVRDTVVHEVAHFFGIDDESLREMGL